MYAVHRDASGTADAYAVYWMKHDWPRSVPSGVITVEECVASTPVRERRHLAVPVRRRPRRDRRGVEPAGGRAAAPPAPRAATAPLLRERRVVGPAPGRRGGARGAPVPDRRADRVRGRRPVPTRERRPVRALRRRAGPGAVRAPTRTPTSRGRSTSWERRTSGGSSFRQLWWARQVEERTPGSLDLADAMFASSPAPWCVVFFARPLVRPRRHPTPPARPRRPARRGSASAPGSAGPRTRSRGGCGTGRSS